MNKSTSRFLWPVRVLRLKPDCVYSRKNGYKTTSDSHKQKNVDFTVSKTAKSVTLY